MNRDSYIKKLLAWNTSSHRKPLILEGARQVGKTWLMKEFAKKHFQNVVYIRFDKDKLLRRVFDADFDVKRIVHELEIARHVKIRPETTIVLFDEIQACKNALTSLKYFCEDYPELPVIAAGSLLGLEYRDDDDDAKGHPKDGDEYETTGFPVGKVDLLKVYPLTFAEYLDVTGEGALFEEIKEGQWSTLEVFHDRLADMVRHYFIIGGMPEVVSRYVENGDFQEVRRLQRSILADYRKDFAKHAPKADVRKIEMIWDSIPEQLAKENKKFIYSAVKPRGRASEFRDPLEWLVGAGLIYKVYRAKVPQLPLCSYADSAFKVFMLDVGLLSAMSDLDPAVILDAPRIFKEFKGSLTEQYVHQELVAQTDLALHYWSTEDSRTEVDFVFSQGRRVCPLEVKSEDNVRSKSLKAYEKRFHPERVYRASMMPHVVQRVPVEDGVSCELVNIPLYALSLIND